MGAETVSSLPSASPSPSVSISTTPSPSITPRSTDGSWDTTIGLIGIILAVAALAIGIRKPDVSTPLKALLSVLETVVLLVSVVLFGWLGLAIFLVSAIIAFVLYGIRLAMRQESLLVSAAIESDTTKEEMEAVHKHLHKSHARSSG